MENIRAKTFYEMLFSSQFQVMLIKSAEMFVQLFVELAVLFLAISYLVSLMNQRLPAERIQRLLGGRKGRGYLTAAALGAVTPFCSCSTIPMLIALLKAGAGFGPTMTFLFTSPLLNPIVIALFIPVFGLEFTLWYGSLAFVTSILAGVLLQALGFERYIKREFLGPQEISRLGDGDDSNTCCDAIIIEEPSICRTAWTESWQLFRSMMPYMLVAMVIGAVVHGFVPAEFFAKLASADNPAAVPTAALIGIPLYIRVTALLPLVGSFAAKGVSLGAIAALVIGSGGASLPEMILLKKIFYWPLLLAFLTVIFCMAVITGFALNSVLI